MCRVKDDRNIPSMQAEVYAFMGIFCRYCGVNQMFLGSWNFPLDDLMKFYDLSIFGLYI